MVPSSASTAPGERLSDLLGLILALSSVLSGASKTFDLDFRIFRNLYVRGMGSPGVPRRGRGISSSSVWVDDTNSTECFPGDSNLTIEVALTVPPILPEAMEEFDRDFPVLIDVLLSRFDFAETPCTGSRSGCLVVVDLAGDSKVICVMSSVGVI
jgi:hypothetical protein